MVKKMKKFYAFSIVGLLLSLFWSCTVSTRSIDSQVAPDVYSAENQYSTQSQEYRIRFSDQLAVHFTYKTEWNQSILVRDDGIATFWHIGDLAVVGLTTEQLADTLINLYSEWLHQPELVVILRESAPLRYYVYGEVKNVGVYQSRKPVNMLQAITTAGGATARSELRSVLLLHVEKDWQMSIRTIDLNTLTGSYNLDIQPFMIQDFDVIIVPTKFISNVHDFIRDYFVKLMPPVDTFIRDRYYWMVINDRINP